jgi:hypothetical protein
LKEKLGIGLHFFKRVKGWNVSGFRVSGLKGSKVQWFKRFRVS